MEILIIVIFVLILVAWIYVLDRRKYCSKCGAQLDKAGNDYYCRSCHKLWHMGIFGNLKEK